MGKIFLFKIFDRIKNYSTRVFLNFLFGINSLVKRYTIGYSHTKVEDKDKGGARAPGPAARRARAVRVQLRERGRGRAGGARLRPRARAVPLPVREPVPQLCECVLKLEQYSSSIYFHFKYFKFGI